MSEIRCEQVLEELEVYLDGELGEEECERIIRHLEGCGECTRREGFLRALRDLIRRKCRAADAPPGLEERILRAISGA